jgi:hypothetical protein|mmetsp:Transcript_31423/g.51284  ORF Transcript_31423/g.51284 Transcript_31423/m.51284 type:complete len:109 (+) Transcript_31423:13-339(+)
MMVQIDLSELTSAHSKVLAGHQRGVAARALYHIDDLDEDNVSDLVIVAPGQLETISPSFVQGFLGATLKKIGPDALKKRLNLSALKPFLRDDFIIGIQRLTLRSQVEH